MSPSLEFIPFPPLKGEQPSIQSIDLSTLLGRTCTTQLHNNSAAEAINAAARFAIATGAIVIAFMLTQHGIRAGSEATITSALRLIGVLSKS